METTKAACASLGRVAGGLIIANNGSLGYVRTFLYLHCTYLLLVRFLLFRKRSIVVRRLGEVSLCCGIDSFRAVRMMMDYLMVAEMFKRPMIK